MSCLEWAWLRGIVGCAAIRLRLEQSIVFVRRRSVLVWSVLALLSLYCSGRVSVVLIDDQGVGRWLGLGRGAVCPVAFLS